MVEAPHFEIPADDLARAESFYKSVFGWETKKVVGMEFIQLRTSPGKDAAFPKGVTIGGIALRAPPVMQPVIVITVEDIDQCIERARGRDGKVLKSKFAVSTFGFSAYIEDTEGNVVGLWQDRR